jgi:hypothetical protein
MFGLSVLSITFQALVELDDDLDAAASSTDSRTIRRRFDINHQFFPDERQVLHPNYSLVGYLIPR